MGRKVGTGCLAVVGVLSAGLAMGGPRQEAQEWGATEVQLRGLEPEARFDGFAIRPPKGAQHGVREDDREKRFIWALTAGDRPAGGLAVLLARNPSPGLPLERAVPGALEVVKQRTTNLVGNPPERGSIGGRPFARVRFRADSYRGMDGGPVFGFLYLTYAEDGKTPIILSGFGKAELIETLEASALTFRALD